ncbi:MAG TPA: YiiX/YebB-like N1pC/P60 family cysteine hydrolase [Bacteroidia bacterium]|nr:YiiX/YebB-like N1pC/P60 family cysteine hydrolase [Bacteroidia bacterium]
MKKFSDILLVFVVTGTLVLLLLTGSGWIEPVTAHMQPAQVRNSWISAAPDQNLLKSGDLIFRHGRGFISNAFQTFSRKDPRYSHAGIIEIENGRAYVYHCIGGEENKTNRMKKEMLETFCRPDQVHAFGIYRTDLTTEQLNKVHSGIHKYYAQGMEFDTDFSMESDDRMYCTEMLYKLLTAATGYKNFLPLTHITGHTYVSCDNIYLSPHCREIYTYKYRN